MNKELFLAMAKQLAIQSIFVAAQTTIATVVQHKVAEYLNKKEKPTQ